MFAPPWLLYSIALVFVLVTMMYSLRKGHNRVWKLILYCSAFAAVGRIQCPHGDYQSWKLSVAYEPFMGPRSLCVAAGESSASCVISVVRDSRMWCPQDIGRDSWVWGEQEALKMINSPHELGDETPSERSPCREEAGWPVDVSD